MRTLPPFTQRFPWWGGDLQTLATALIDAPSSLAPATSERLSIKLADGDLLTLDLAVRLDGDGLFRDGLGGRGGERGLA